VKAITDSDSTGASIARARVQREAQAMAQVSHPNVAAVYDVGTHNEQVFIAMELITGQTLRDWLAETQRSWRQIVQAFVAAGRGLSAAHAQGLVHRDFKPSNVLVGTNGRVAVVDFGLARTTREPLDAHEPLSTKVQDSPRTRAGASASLTKPSLLGTALTQAGNVPGTPKYMAPEQFRGLLADARSDQFSFCVALFEALYRTLPYGNAREMAGLAKDVASSAKPTTPSGKAAGPAWLRRAVCKGLSLDPGARHASMDTLLLALSTDPAAAARRYAGGVALIALVAGAAFTLARVSALQGQRCKGFEGRLIGIWDDSAKAKVRSAFAATGMPYALDTWRNVEKSLDAYSAEWMRSRTEACEATWVRKEQSEELLGHRMSCLDLGLEELRATTRLFQLTDAAVLARAAQAALALSDPRRCGELPHLLKAMGRAPRDEPTRRADEELRKKLAQAHALERAGKRSESLELARQVLAEGNRLKSRALEAEANQLIGWVQSKRGDFSASAAALAEAAYGAEATQNDELSAMASARLIFVFGEYLHDLAAAGLWARHTEAKIERLLGVPPLQASTGPVSRTMTEPVALYLNNRGLLLSQLGRAAEAAEHFDAALKLQIDADGPDHPKVAVLLNDQVVGLTRLGRHDRVLEKLHRSLAIIEGQFGLQHPQLGIFLINIAEELKVQGRNDEALPLYWRAVRILESADGHVNPYIAYALDGIGLATLDKGEPQEAMGHFKEALAIRAAIDTPDPGGTGMSYAGLGKAMLAQGDLREALPLLERAISLGGGHLDLPLAYADTRFALARVLRGLKKDPARALELAKEALSLHEANHAPASATQPVRDFIENSSSGLLPRRADLGQEQAHSPAPPEKPRGPE
jgi:tetratricopeptide (TPR) repeat protein